MVESVNPDNMKEKEIIKKYLRECKLMQVATSEDNMPRIFNCWFSYDDKFNFYYISPHTAKHSKAIKKHPYVAASIVSPNISQVGVGKDVQGLMFEGQAFLVEGKELIKAYMNFLKKHPNLSQYVKLINNKVEIKSTKIYKIIPNKGIWFDQINFEDEPRRKIKFN